MKLYTFLINKDAREGRLLPYARRMLPDVPEYAIREAFEKRDVKLNGVRVGKDAVVVPGAEVKVYARETAARKLVRILYQDADVLVVIKPTGISCEKDAKGGKTITELVKDELLRSDPNAKEPLLCHRLDNQTDGLLLLAKNQDAYRELTLAFKQRQIHKEYTCIVKGTPAEEHCIWRAYLQKDARNARVSIIHKPRGEAVSVITEYTVLTRGASSRLKVKLHTGRTHQIRAHMAAMGYPLLGDDQYGDRVFNKQMKARRLMLTATALSFDLEGRLSYLNEMKFTYQPRF